jgi:hypothetical protein
MSVDVNLFKNKNMSTAAIACGVTPIQNSCQGNSSSRILALYSDGFIGSYQCMPLSTADSNKKPTIDSFFKGVPVNLISKSDLPKDVKMPVNFFEKMKNLMIDSE